MKTRGFTLIELIMVMILVGVLAVAVIPRLFDRTTFFARGFYDESLAALRYAQKQAIAQRRTVCVAFASATQFTLRVASTAGATTCDTNLASPAGGSPFTVTAKTGAAFSSQPTDFSFNAFGQPQTNISRTLTVTDVATITIEKETGYVH